MSNQHTKIKLIVGLGNPGQEYEATRHNAGAWFVNALASHHLLSLKLEKKFQGKVQKLNLQSQECYLFNPETFMNHSGQAVQAISRYYQIQPEEILICHDELDLALGTLRLKQGGGHGGHNGLRDIISHLGSANFYRLRIGIGHPGHRDKVHGYVLSAPSQQDKQKILSAIDETLGLIPELLTGNIAKAMQALHTEK